MQENHNIFLYFMMLALLLTAFLLPQNSFAYSTASDVATVYKPDKTKEKPCADNTSSGSVKGTDWEYAACIQNKATKEITVCPGEGLTTRIIPCIRDVIIQSTNYLLAPFSKYLSKIISICCVLAMVFFGVQLLTGRADSISKEGMVLGIKIGAVLLFTSNFGNLYQPMLNVIEELVTMVIKPATASILTKGCEELPATAYQSSEKDIFILWHTIDCYLNNILGGILKKGGTIEELKTGLMGFLFSLLFSSAIGFFIGIIGLAMIVITLITIARCLYIFITAYIAFSFMVLISPIFVTCILFKHTKPYFDSWLQMSISFIIQPVFLMGYLVMFLLAFDQVVFHSDKSLYHILAGKDADEDSFKIGTWLDGTSGKGLSVYKEESLATQGVNINPQGKADVTKKLPGKIDTATIDTQGQYDIDNKFWEAGKKGVLEHLGLGTDKNPLNFFMTDIPVNTLNWEQLAQRADNAGYVKAKGDKEALSEFYKDYKITVFLSFIMVILVMYIFYSMLEFMPFIGTGVMGGMGDGAIALGGGRLAPLNKSNAAAGARR